MSGTHTSRHSRSQCERLELFPPGNLGRRLRTSRTITTHKRMASRRVLLEFHELHLLWRCHQLTFPRRHGIRVCAGSLGAELAGYPGAAYCAYFGTVPPFSGSGLAGSGGISTPLCGAGLADRDLRLLQPHALAADIAGFASSFWFHALLLCDSKPGRWGPLHLSLHLRRRRRHIFVAPYTAGEVVCLVAATGSRQGVAQSGSLCLAKAQYAAPGDGNSLLRERADLRTPV